jgi:hypothetical protein
MAHFAKLDSSNKVIHVSVVNNTDIMDSNWEENENKGIEYLSKMYGHSNWKQTSYNGNFRKNYAGIGYTYDENLDAFIPPKPYESWILNTETCLWEPPIPTPKNSSEYIWDETIKNWKQYEM